MPKHPPSKTSAAPSSDDLHIRIRSVFGHRWVWELRSADGHVVNSSQGFSTRDECEADAQRQGEPIRGLRAAKVPARRVAPELAGVDFVQDDAELWRWELRSPAGDVIDQCAWAFLTREECEADFRERRIPR